MGNSSYYSQNGNAQTIIVHQEGAGQNCDCGPARFNFSPYHNDQRLLGHGLSEAQICGYFDGLNEYLRKNTRSPCVWICPSLLCVLAYLVLQNVTGMEEGGADEQEDENADAGHEHDDGEHGEDKDKVRVAEVDNADAKKINNKKVAPMNATKRVPVGTDIICPVCDTETQARADHVLKAVLQKMQVFFLSTEL